MLVKLFMGILTLSTLNLDFPGSVDGLNLENIRVIEYGIPDHISLLPIPPPPQCRPPAEQNAASYAVFIGSWKLDLTLHSKTWIMVRKTVIRTSCETSFFGSQTKTRISTSYGLLSGTDLEAADAWIKELKDTITEGAEVSLNQPSEMFDCSWMKSNWKDNSFLTATGVRVSWDIDGTILSPFSVPNCTVFDKMRCVVSDKMVMYQSGTQAVQGCPVLLDFVGAGFATDYNKTLSSSLVSLVVPSYKRLFWIKKTDLSSKNSWCNKDNNVILKTRGGYLISVVGSNGEDLIDKDMSSWPGATLSMWKKQAPGLKSREIGRFLHPEGGKVRKRRSVSASSKKKNLNCLREGLNNLIELHGYDLPGPYCASGFRLNDTAVIITSKFFPNSDVLVSGDSNSYLGMLPSRGKMYYFPCIETAAVIYVARDKGGLDRLLKKIKILANRDDYICNDGRGHELIYPLSSDLTVKSEMINIFSGHLTSTVKSNRSALSTSLKLPDVGDVKLVIGDDTIAKSMKYDGTSERVFSVPCLHVGKIDSQTVGITSEANSESIGIDIKNCDISGAPDFEKSYPTAVMKFQMDGTGYKIWMWKLTGSFSVDKLLQECRVPDIDGICTSRTGEQNKVPYTLTPRLFTALRNNRADIPLDPWILSPVGSGVIAETGIRTRLSRVINKDKPFASKLQGSLRTRRDLSSSSPRRLSTQDVDLDYNRAELQWAAAEMTEKSAKALTKLQMDLCTNLQDIYSLALLQIESNATPMAVLMTGNVNSRGMLKGRMIEVDQGAYVDPSVVNMTEIYCGSCMIVNIEDRGFSACLESSSGKLLPIPDTKTCGKVPNSFIVGSFDGIYIDLIRKTNHSGLGYSNVQNDPTVYSFTQSVMYDESDLKTYGTTTGDALYTPGDVPLTTNHQVDINWFSWLPGWSSLVSWWTDLGMFVKELLIAFLVGYLLLALSKMLPVLRSLWCCGTRSQGAKERASARANLI